MNNAKNLTIFLHNAYFPLSIYNNTMKKTVKNKPSYFVRYDALKTSQNLTTMYKIMVYKIKTYGYFVKCPCMIVLY